MTEMAYDRATDILVEKETLEKLLSTLPDNNSEEYINICNKLFQLGQEFASL